MYSYYRKQLIYYYFKFTSTEIADFPKGNLQCTKYLNAFIICLCKRSPPDFVTNHRFPKENSGIVWSSFKHDVKNVVFVILHGHKNCFFLFFDFLVEQRVPLSL